MPLFNITVLAKSPEHSRLDDLRDFIQRSERNRDRNNKTFDKVKLQVSVASIGGLALLCQNLSSAGAKFFYLACIGGLLLIVSLTFSLLAFKLGASVNQDMAEKGNAILEKGDEDFSWDFANDTCRERVANAFDWVGTITLPVGIAVSAVFISLNIK